MSNSFAALERLSDSEVIDRAWESNNENLKTRAKESLGLREFKQRIQRFHVERFFFRTMEEGSEISPTRCNNCVFILRNGFTLHVSGDNLTHHQEYICVYGHR